MVVSWADPEMSCWHLAWTDAVHDAHRRMLLFLKLALVPALVASVTLAARKWGPRIGGWLTALPIIAGPTLCFYAIEQGTDFAARAAQGTLIGLVAVVAHSVTYTWTSRRFGVLISLLSGWIAFAV